MLTWIVGFFRGQWLVLKQKLLGQENYAKEMAAGKSCFEFTFPLVHVTIVIEDEDPANRKKS